MIMLLQKVFEYIKTEIIYSKQDETTIQAKLGTFKNIEILYNRKINRSSLWNKSRCGFDKLNEAN